MPFTTTAKNNMLDALRVLMTHASLHSAFPGATGLNEIAGGSYARKATGYNAAAAGETALSAAQLFDVPAAATVAWVGAWGALSGGTFYGYAPNGSTGVAEFTADAATDVITSPAHGFSDTQTIVFYGGTPPAGLTEGTTYFVRDATADTFKVAATSGGVAINLTSAGSNLCVVSRIVVETFTGAGQVNLTTFSHNLNLG
ncbi:MAG: hypothetical protein WC803_08800 [Sphingomonas sp.]|jgi:hypothetical protein